MTTTYGLTCSNAYGSGSCSATATIGSALPVTCSPVGQTVNVGQIATLTASGGTGSYTWSTDGTPSSGSGSSFSTSFSNPGPHSVFVVSGGNSYLCYVQVNAIQPDLTITDFHLTDAAGNTKTAFAAGELIYPWVTIKNNGLGPASGSGGYFYISIFSNKPSPVSAGASSEVNVWAYEPGSIAAGASKTYSITTNNVNWHNDPTGGGIQKDNWVMSSIGSYTARAFVDSWNAVIETDEGNNQATSPYNISVLPCAGKQCGDPCVPPAVGVCDGPGGTCYAGGCFLNCNIPSPGAGNWRQWSNPACGRTGSIKCAAASVCGNSLASCAIGGASTPVTGNWGAYNYPSGTYGVGQTFQISLGGVTRSPAGFTILSECAVNLPNGSVIYFNNWGTDVTYPYTFRAADPEGIWTVNYCGLWSDFNPNSGWPLKQDNTPHQFIFDKTPPSITINKPKQNDTYAANFIVNATVMDTYSSINKVFYRWENGTNGSWVEMTLNNGYYTANFNVNLVSDGAYSIRVRANDSVGNANEAVVANVRIDRTPPSFTILSPVPGWYDPDILVKVMAGGQIDVVRYRWENASDTGPWVPLTLGADGNYTAVLSVASMGSGNYTIRVWINNSLGVVNIKTVDIGLDQISPSSQMTSPIAGSYMMSTKFNISWTGSDAHSGVRCYYVTYKYCDNLGSCPSTEYNVSFPGGKCTTLLEYEFNPSSELPSIPDFNNYTFFFRSVALDNAGNLEPKSVWETNATIFISELVTFTVTETTTGATVSNGGKVATGRTVNIDVKARDHVSGTLDITIYYYSHIIGASPPKRSSDWNSKPCTGVRECIASISIDVSEAEDKKEVDYFIMASAGSTELLPPDAPSSYFHYIVYRHPICNFLVNDVFRTVMGSSDLIVIEVRNIQDKFGMVGLKFDSGLARFLESDQQYAQIPMNPMEEKIIYARLISPSPTTTGTLLVMTGNSTADLSLQDQDTITITVGYPANFSELSDFAAIVLVLLAGLIYLKWVKI